MIEFIVPGVPVGKERPRLGNGRVYTPAKTRTYETVVGLHARRAMAGLPPIEGPVWLHVTCTFAPPASWSKRRRELAMAGLELPIGRPDADNLLKAVKDALNAIVYRDDAQVVDAHVRKVYGAEAGVQIGVGRLRA